MMVTTRSHSSSSRIFSALISALLARSSARTFSLFLSFHARAFFALQGPQIYDPHLICPGVGKYSVLHLGQGRLADGAYAMYAMIYLSCIATKLSSISPTDCPNVTGIVGCRISCRSLSRGFGSGSPAICHVDDRPWRT